MEAPRSAGTQFQECAPPPERNSYESQASASSWYSSSDGDARLSAAGELAGIERAASAPQHLIEALDGLGGISLDQVRRHTPNDFGAWAPYGFGRAQPRRPPHWR
jgi:hypothetical protein